MSLCYAPLRVASSLIFTTAQRGTDEEAATKGSWEDETRWLVRNTENSAGTGTHQHMLPIVLLLCLCQVYPLATLHHLYLGEWSLFVSNVFPLSPVATVFPKASFPESSC